MIVIVILHTLFSFYSFLRARIRYRRSVRSGMDDGKARGRGSEEGRGGEVLEGGFLELEK